MLFTIDYATAIESTEICSLRAPDFTDAMIDPNAPFFIEMKNGRIYSVACENARECYDTLVVALRDDGLVENFEWDAHVLIDRV